MFSNRFPFRVFSQFDSQNAMTRTCYNVNSSLLITGKVEMPKQEITTGHISRLGTHSPCENVSIRRTKSTIVFLLNFPLLTIPTRSFE